MIGSNLVTAIDDITEGILASKVETDDSVGWLSFDRDTHRHPAGRRTLRASPGIYSGRLGVAVYLAALEAADGPWRVPRDEIDTILDAVGPSADPTQYTSTLGVGIGDGVGSVVYGLSVLNQLTGSDRHAAAAERIARAFTEKRIGLTETYDVLLGLAGAIHGLCKLSEVTDCRVGLDRAVVCGERLLETRQPKWGTRVWDTHPGSISSCSTGMGHGVAGIAHALYRLFDHTDRTEFRDAADDALVYERAFYDPARNNWRANWSAIGHFRNWWCYGTPGIGLARLGSVEAHDTAHLREDLSRAAGYSPELGERDALCHGTFTQVAFLTELGRRRDTDYYDAAEELARRAVERSRDGGYRVVCGDPRSPVNPSLFLGTAGVGYTLLRLSAPDSLPAVTRFE